MDDHSETTLGRQSGTEPGWLPDDELTHEWLKHMEEHRNNTFGQNVRRRREEMGLDITDTAWRAGISRSWLSRIERGERDPYLTVALRLADVLHVNLCDLIQERAE